MIRPISRRSLLRTASLTVGAAAMGLRRAAAYPGNYRSGIPESAGDAISKLYNDGDGLKHVAFTHDDGWVLLWGRNGWQSHAIPGSLEEKLHELNEAGKAIKQVAFSPDDDWIVLFDHDHGLHSWSSLGMPSRLNDALHRLDEDCSTIKCVAFTRDGGWVVLYGFNGFIAEGIPDSARSKLTELQRGQWPLKQIAFTADDGWVILYGANGWSGRGYPDKASEKLGEYNNQGLYVHSIAFTSDDGWVITQNRPEHAETRYWRIAGGDVSVAPLHVYAHDFGDAHNRNRILQQAAYVLHDRFMNWNVVRNSYQVSGSAYYIRDAYWNESRVALHPTYGPRELLWYQLKVLCQPPSAQQAVDEGPPMPEIHLYPYYKPSNEVGFARWANRVMVKYEGGSTVRRTGDFHVHLNTYNLGGAGHGSDPYYWACVIAHEMLHNLGHAHDIGDYGDNRQINCFHRAVYCNGKYGGQSTPNVICGCKPPI